MYPETIYLHSALSKLWDPEKAKGSSDGSGYPLNRVITVGFNANF